MKDNTRLDIKMSSPNKYDRGSSSSSFENETKLELRKNTTDNFRLLEPLELVDDESPKKKSVQQHEDGELTRILSLHSIQSTASSAADRQYASQVSSHKIYRKIGAGACGAIFAQDGKPRVTKFAKTDDNMLRNDYLMHTSIYENFRRFGNDKINIPQCYFFVSKTDPDYLVHQAELLNTVQDVCNLPADILVTERIFPLSSSIRKHLIQQYCAPRNKAKAFEDAANKDCLVRLYLGSQQGTTGGMFFSLRNFKLHLNQMIDLGLDVESFAISMASALSIMHWGAQTDARDVEFVLGSSATEKPLQRKMAAEIRKMHPLTSTGPAGNTEDFFHRTTEFWVLDFNQVNRISMDESGVAAALLAVKLNDPYFPRPLQKTNVEKRLWNTFVKTYLMVASSILKGDKQALRLPELFIKGLIDMQRKKLNSQIQLNGENRNV